MKRAPRIGFSILVGAMALATGALAQNIGDPGTTAPSAPGDAPAPAAPAPGPAPADTAAPAPGQPSQSVTTVYRPMGLPSPGYDPNPGLPSSSKPSLDASRSGDTFDLGGPSSSAETARGDANASGVLGKRTSTV